MDFSHKLLFDERLYDAQVLQKAAYRSINVLTVDITSDGKQFVCALSSNIGMDEQSFLSAVQEFKKDALDYQLRHRLAVETQPIKNLILGLAFSKTGLISE
ncbi:His-Xaa-Ser system protein HxsD [Pseudomonas rhodesiae]|uniref:His-Xaa-Ser system protein HxsD n=1 Tax=Pseudomonas rhodesiae TaxID=76760 RepID=A0AAE8KXH9_9PSED|nr:His-Xaa-Ser system protein HxsD [Pseudomonas rhodesiae]ROM59912.1 His-Xaa-Ser system protein HxsD [Pseudomonas rhodesiae]ROM68566.1 His-Xaa-Ser system protein HxsD [Pseudomonas rhodesiae]TWR56078.1 His-Xaa-Ser system protein HxsD [Pseudomonas rhodesiae]WLI28672.1 His-Xaa-Ser system protein HxsD [Pseudomonas rhodesiae]SDU89256.1 His-Xaa-Ser system protein HxsD [Pseudomonas rhodesiae]